MEIHRIVWEKDRLMKRPAPLAKKILLALVSAMITLLMLEAGLRVLAYFEDRKLLVNTRLNDHPVTTGEKVTLRSLFRVHPDPKIIFELKPGMYCEYKKAKLTTNRHGFRSADITIEKAPGVFRILGLGDSVMFGEGVSDRETYLSRLEERLQEGYPRLKVQTINTAVSGYNTVMQIATLKEKGLKFDPDLVILSFVGNDLDLPNFIRTTRNFWAPDRSFLFDFLMRKWAGAFDTRTDILCNAPKSEENPFRFEHEPERVPAEYADMVGLESFKRAVSELRDLSIEHGFKVLIFSHWKIQTDVRGVLKDLGFPVIEGYGVLKQYLKDHGMSVEDYRGSPLTISKEDPHPTALSHRLLGDLLFDQLRVHFREFIPDKFYHQQKN